MAIDIESEGHGFGGAAMISVVARGLVWVSLVSLFSGALSWATALRLAPRQGRRYYHSASRRLFAIGVLTGLAAVALIVWT